MQGIGAAFAAPAALSILTGTFAEGAARNRALAIFGVAGASAASLGLVLGGALTAGPGWEWVFLMNVPIGTGLISLALVYIPSAPPEGRGSADLAGAVAVTTALMAIVYALNGSIEHGWTSRTTVGFLGVGAVLLLVFVAVERRVPSPMLPLSVFRHRTLTIANLVAALVFGSFLGFNLQISLFMQHVVRYTAIEAGVAWLATSIGAAVVGIGVAARAVDRFGAGLTLAAGQSSAAAGLLWFARTPADATYLTDLFPGLLLVGVGIGLSGMAVQVAAFIGIDKSVAGLAGGMIESFREIGGSLGTAVVATVVVARSQAALARSDARALAFTEGVHWGAIVAVAFSVAAAVVAGIFLRRAERQHVSTTDDL